MQPTLSRTMISCIGFVVALVCTALSVLPASAAGPTVAYAHVRGDGTLNTANSKNVMQKIVVATIAEDPTAPNQGPGSIRASVPPTPFFTCTNMPTPSSVVATFNQDQRSAGGYAFYVYWTK